MKDATYVGCAAIGLLLVGAGLAQIQAAQTAQPRQNDIPAMIREHITLEGFPRPVEGPSSSGMATVAELLFGYILQMIGCALYAENRGRSAFFGLLGLLSPIGYVFLSLLNPATRSVPQHLGPTHVLT